MALQSALPAANKSAPQQQLVQLESRNPSCLRLPLSSKWREIQGADNWCGLLPSQHRSSDDDQFQDAADCFKFDQDLRSEIIKYGELAQVCYDAFDNDEQSQFRGSCKFTRSRLLQETTGGLVSRGYQVTKYLYATAHLDLPSFFAKPQNNESAWSNDSNWMGFVAVSNSEDEISRLGRRDIVISWRGTVTGLEWMENLHDILRPTGLDPSDKQTRGVRVESGFLSMYTSRNPRSRFNKLSARQQLLSEIQRLLHKYQGEELSITITGHSLGGALALLSAYDLAELGINHRAQTTVISFSAPRVGNRFFARVPGILFNEHHPVLSDCVESLLPWTYTHVGTELALDTSDSPYLRHDADLVAQHSLEALLHLVDGYQGPSKTFQLSGELELAFVNKNSDLLRPSCGIPSLSNYEYS